MKSFLGQMFFVASIAIGAITVSAGPAKAYYPPQCVNAKGARYCLSSYYDASRCIQKKYYGHTYTYCRSATGAAGHVGGY